MIQHSEDSAQSLDVQLVNHDLLLRYFIWNTVWARLRPGRDWDDKQTAKYVVYFLDLHIEHKSKTTKGLKILKGTHFAFQVSAQI